MANELVGRSHVVLQERYGERLKAYRRLFHAVVGPRAVPNYTPFLEIKTAQLLKAFADNPEDFGKHLRR